ncbi:class I SAM-dependent methyltransferase [Pseudomonas sp. GD03860]|uniref:class I SAM-dependent methyltransferase n=1 Tax=Pseudomonas TaxID=286 RepID=UPI0023646F4E|nr:MULTISPECIES: class I SAM-dependent methyltransferase [Pseudomonas]MDD2058957.1 class I SAM-dependent methyltransferase [Pseudomonas putida]MDH0639897.1 class I SAM-dependent methyltransferase [Pseudomonas sp. GD03860]
MQLSEKQRHADEALLQLGRRLQADGYRFTCVTPLTQARNNARPGAEQARTLRDIFGWNRPFDASLLSPDELGQLQRAQLVERQGERLRSRIRWSSLDDVLFAHSSFPTDSVDAVFFGPDSYRFAQLIQTHLQDSVAPINHAVDIGCGAGVGAVLIARARRHAQVSALDINDQALRMTAINVALAGLANVSVEHSDVLQGVTGQFDLIVANPPYMLDAGERAYRHGGGALGEQLSLRIVEEALPRLAPGGTLLLYTGVAMVEGRDPFLAALHAPLADTRWAWRYQELDPDVFGEQLLEPGYQQVERIAAVALSVSRR